MKEVASGGVIYRQQSGKKEILLIQDRFGYWTFPKGKKEKDETDEQTALREIKEETGIEGKVIEKIHQMNYRYHHPERGQVQKEVNYFIVTFVQGVITPQPGEVEAAKWFTLPDAEKKLTNEGYPNQKTFFALVKKRLHELG